MRIITENTTNYLHSLAVAIGKDPASMEQWRCLHIAQKDETPYAWFEKALQSLKEAHHEIDCDMVHCTDNDILLISHHLHDATLSEIAHELTCIPGEVADVKVEITIYDMFRDWRTIRDLLLTKTTQSPPLAAGESKRHHFGEIDSLQEVFAEAKNLRKARMPLHVMLVEDDPLTRRLVAGTFKENYALITAANAEEAVANYLLHAPDIVFLDIGLPDASGLDVLHRIMASDPDAYVVMFSGNSYLDNITAALGTGASGFVAKPFKKDKMQHYIQDSALHHHKYA